MSQEAPVSVENQYFDAAQFELAGRLILGDLPVTLLPGSWWSYIPSQNLILYPQTLLTEWNVWRMVGAVCHEAAEARFTGTGGSAEVAKWLRRASRHGLSAPSAQLLVNTVNDMRVNRLHLRRYPGSEVFFKALYSDEPELHAKDDLRLPPGLDLDRHRPPHHAYVDALTLKWIESSWPELNLNKEPAPPGAVSQAVKRTWKHIVDAADSDDIDDMLTTLEKKVLPAYAELVHQWDPDDPYQGESKEPGPEPDDDSPGQPEDEAPQDVESLPGAGPGRGVSVGGSNTPPKQMKTLSKVTAESVRMRIRAGARPGLVRRGAPTEAERRSIEPISASVVQQLRRSTEERIDYTKFDYLEAVESLEDKITETIEGDGRRPGLAELMDRRRHGATEAMRRPRKQRCGDQGEIDMEHPEKLATDPSAAFLRGVRIPREDQQRDFAGSILLDVSGSMVQKGYPTRKFDRLVETAILFIEIHERLAIPFEVTAFSSEVTSLIEFPKSPTKAKFRSMRDYHPNDHSAIFRKLYELDHKDTDDSAALNASIENCSRQKGLRSIFVITDGISSDPAELRRALIDLDRKNRNSSEQQRMKVLAFGVGVVESEFQQAYQPKLSGKRLGSCSGVVVEDLKMLPVYVREAVDQRIRYA
ncbi:MAG: VWA domain-containing protein [Chloroflexi bacterium]|nr:VWA domain-containing protein [Chloroflexota bacterium]MCY3937231.1 VWA domain-containing protein [Chloroflexota bacterium]